jgi:hypothetical protein
MGNEQTMRRKGIERWASFLAAYVVVRVDIVEQVLVESIPMKSRVLNEFSPSVVDVLPSGHVGGAMACCAHLVASVAI